MKTSPALLVALVTIASPLAADDLPTATPAEVGLAGEALERIRPVLEGLVEGGQLAGTVTLVAREGRIVHLDTIGWQDIEERRPMARDTIFRLYSMSKPITAAGALILVDDGRLDLDDPIDRYLPAFADVRVLDGWGRVEPVRKPTVRDLLRHTAGLSYGMGLTRVDLLYHLADVFDPTASLEIVTDRLAGLPLLHQPGTRFHYSLGVDVLGRILEVVSGTSLDRFLAERIFEPLAMVDTGFDVPADRLDRLATLYSPTLFSGLEPSTADGSPAWVTPSLLSGGGGLVSTAIDYWRFLEMLAGGGSLGGVRILEPETVELMTTNQLPEGVPFEFAFLPAVQLGFGLGLSVRLPADGVDPLEVGECAWGGAASTGFLLHPRERLVAVVMTQKLLVDRAAMETVRESVYEALGR